jgi:hypothetical protein
MCLRTSRGRIEGRSDVSAPAEIASRGRENSCASAQELFVTDSPHLHQEAVIYLVVDDGRCDCRLPAAAEHACDGDDITDFDIGQRFFRSRRSEKFGVVCRTYVPYKRVRAPRHADLHRRAGDRDDARAAQKYEPIVGNVHLEHRYLCLGSNHGCLCGGRGVDSAGWNVGRCGCDIHAQRKRVLLVYEEAAEDE